ncbi:hypothetical protein KS4_35010 [Poriferisphaera corsica]|uniref:Uncharacterized protein n=1 Tax=Poriferisphaera corsica TaxID=2528020 RepID=A0A517YYV7_9BACT|nr:PEP-CTERM sorting domain-containing protein [Poriferisphaera corsica]QDU35420.1 hypothetical protein KS4_35010 [Poriferisphaera corsica]
MNLCALSSSLVAGVLLCSVSSGAVMSWNTVDHFEASIDYGELEKNQEAYHYAMAAIGDDGQIGFVDTVDLYDVDSDSRMLVKRFDSDGNIGGTVLYEETQAWLHTKLQWMNGNLYFGSKSGSLAEDRANLYYEWNDGGVSEIYRNEPGASDAVDKGVTGIYQMGMGTVRQVGAHQGYDDAFVYRSAETGEDRVIASTSTTSSEDRLGLQVMLRPNPEGMTEIYKPSADGGLVMGLRTDEGSKIVKFNGEGFETLVTGEDVVNAVDGSVSASMDGYALPYPLATNSRGDLAFIAMSSVSDTDYMACIDLLVKRDGELVHAGRLLSYKDSWANKEGLSEFRFQDEMVISENGRVGLIGYVPDSWPSRDFELIVWEGDELIVAADADETYVGTNGREFVYHGSRYENHMPQYEEGIELFTDAVGNMVFNSSVEADGGVGHGVLLYDTEGVLSLLVKEGDLFDVGGGDMREIKTIDEHSFWLNSDGMLAIGLVFMDHSSGVFTMQIPEPSGLMLLGVGGVLGLMRRRVG